MVHYDETAEEIWTQCEGNVDAVIITAGTGGTITGIGRKFKEKDENIQIIGVDPHGSIIALPDSLNEEGVHSYKVEGIGYDFIPKNCDRNIVDKWYKCNDKESFLMARRIIREEGLLVGASSGSCLFAAIQFCKDLNLGPDKRVVVIFVDGIRNYISKFLNDDWMLENGYFTQEEYEKVSFCKYNPVKYYGETNTISDLNLTPVIPVRDISTCKEVLELFNSKNCDYVRLILIKLPVVNQKKELMGFISSKAINNALMSFKISEDDSIHTIVVRDYKLMKMSDSLKNLSKSFSRHQCVIIKDNTGGFYISEHKNVLDHFMLNDK